MSVFLIFLEYFHEASTPIKEPIDCESVFDDFEHLGVNDETSDSNKTYLLHKLYDEEKE